MKWITEEDIKDEWMIQSLPTHTGSSIEDPGVHKSGT